MVSPSTNGLNGRDCAGRFGTGNNFGRGNPFARRTAELRKAFYDAVTADDLSAIAAVVVDKAKAGDLAAAKLILAYAVGSPESNAEAGSRGAFDDQFDTIPREDIFAVLRVHPRDGY